MQIDSLKLEVQRFEKILDVALKEKYSKHSPEFQENIQIINPLYKIDLEKFMNIYLDANQYPQERLSDVIYYCMDFKLELYYLLEVDAGLYNRLVYQYGYNHKNPHKTLHLLLTRQSLDQSLILKSRILWERGMNLIYFLETGEHLEGKVSGRKSKRRIFFEFVNNNLKWKYMRECTEILDKYELDFRSPESHKKSILRAELLGKRTIDSNDIMDLLNYGLNIIWKGIFEIINGRVPNFKFKIVKNA